jgi:hypothetical protein
VEPFKGLSKVLRGRGSGHVVQFAFEKVTQAACNVENEWSWENIGSEDSFV